MKSKGKMMVATLLLSTVILASCGNEKSEGASKKDGDQITFMFRGGEDEKKAYSAAIAQFEKEEDVKVKIISTDADQYATKLQAAISGGNVPDVFYIEQSNLMPYVDNGVLLDITEEIEKSEC